MVYFLKNYLTLCICFWLKLFIFFHRCYNNFINTKTMATVVNVRNQLRDLCTKGGYVLQSCGNDSTAYRRSLITGMFANVATLQVDGMYKVFSTGQLASIHPSSVLAGQKPNCILFNEIVKTSKQYMRDCCILDQDWLLGAAPKFFSKTKSY